jgi:hypothetical protein
MVNLIDVDLARFEELPPACQVIHHFGDMRSCS